MYKIETKVIKKFLQQANLVKPNVLYPALENIKISLSGGEATFVKTNMTVYCVNTFDMEHYNEDATLIVNEAALSAFVGLYNDDTISITLDAKHLTLVNNQSKLSLPIQTEADFPKLPIKPDKLDENNMISPSEIGSIKVASKYLKDDENEGIFHFVHLGDLGIFASNGDYIYHMRTDARLPTILLGRTALDIVTNMPGGAQVSSSENYDFFEDGDLMYAVIKTEFKTFDYSKAISGTSENIVQLRRLDLLNFCTLVSTTAKQEWPLGEIIHEKDDSSLIIDYKDGDFERNANTTIPAKLNFKMKPFRISIRRLNEVLKALPYENLILTQLGPHFKVTTEEDPNYIGVISGMAK